MSSDINLTASSTHRGTWWLPSQPSIRIPGELRYEPATGPRLHLEGALEEHGYAFPAGPRIIHGVSMAGIAITLQRSHFFSRQSALTSTEDLHQDVYRIGTAYLGAHFGTEEDLKFQGGGVVLAGLSSWIHRPPFSVRSPFTLRRRAFEVDLHEEPVCEVTLPVAGGTKIQFVNSWRGSSGDRRFQLDAAPYIRISTAEPQPVSHYTKHIFILRILLSLLQHQADSIRSVELATTPNSNDSISILFNTRPPVPQVDKPAFRMFLPLWRVQDVLSGVLAKWFETEDELGMIRYEYYRSQLATGRGAWETDILALTQLLEGLHRRISSELLMDSDEFLKQTETLKAVLPRTEAPELSKRTEQWLQYANEPTLRKRLKRLLGGMDPGVRARITSAPDGFVEAVVKARNALTHNLTTSTSTALPEDPPGTVLRLRGLLLAKLMMLVGVPAEAVVEGFKEEEHFQYMPGGFRAIRE